MSEQSFNITKIWTALELLKWGTSYFIEKDIESPRLTMELMLCEVLKCSRIQLYVQYEKPLTDKELSDLKLMISKRVQREPLQYIIGKTEFYGLPFFVNASVLIPRPETEILVQKTIHYIQTLSEKSNLSIIDIGTGSGCIAICLAKHLMRNRIVGIDISESALKVARQNATTNEVNVEFIRRDIFKELKVKQPFDIIISNPPYISSEDMQELEPELLNYEPKIALTDSSDGFEFYRRFVKIFKDILSIGGTFFLEFGFGQSDKILELFTCDYECIIHNDLSGIPRIIQGKHKTSIIEK
ncbi:MAG: peptide chain release factor N(5)-glutamine methyltransferase [Bacteroidetes bacterium]|nr:peptide chain release factor N(5)-glutamine methyltransferase [Bacteroidota bacterium]